MAVVGMLIGILALVAGVLVLSFGITSLHTSIEDLHNHIHVNENVVSAHSKVVKDLASQLASLQEAATVARSLEKKVKSQEDASAQLNEEIQSLRKDLSSRVEKLSTGSKQAAEGLHDVEDLKEALTAQKKTNDKMQESVQTLMEQQKDAQRSQKLLESAIESMKASFSKRDEIESLIKALASKEEKVAKASLETAGSSVLRSKASLETFHDDAATATAAPNAEEAKRPIGAGDTAAKPQAAAESTSGAAKGPHHELEDGDKKANSIEDGAAGEGDAEHLPSDAASESGAEQAAEEASVGEASAAASEATNKKGQTSPPPVQTSPPPVGKLLLKPKAIIEAITGHYHVSWYRECGCTGMEIEAVTLLVGLVDKIGKQNVHTNRCEEGCQWPQATKELLSSIEVQDERLLWPAGGAAKRPPGSDAHILVVHAAFEGVCGLPDGLGLPERGEGDNAAGLFRVSRSMMETDGLMAGSAKRCNSQFDAVWVPSAFNVKTFTEASVKANLLHVLHESVDTDLFKCKIGADANLVAPKFGIDRLDQFAEQGRKDPMIFTFFSVFKWESRKNWRVLLDAFWRAFPEDKTSVTLPNGETVEVKARLLIKTQQLSWGSDVRDDVTDFLKSKDLTWEQAKERILIVTRQLPTENMAWLFRSLDAFVLPSHGEGWGLPIMEAMSSGLPTIATEWGGQTEYMTTDNSWPLKYTLKAADLDAAAEEAHLAAGARVEKWAVPDETALTEALLEVAGRTPEVLARAARACEDVRARFSVAHVAEAADELLSGLIRSAHVE